jgi:hypothetical protein
MSKYDNFRLWHFFLQTCFLYKSAARGEISPKYKGAGWSSVLYSGTKSNKLGLKTEPVANLLLVPLVFA